MKQIDIQGQMFGYWKAIEYIPGGKGKKSFWLCECKCGHRSYIPVSSLLKGKSRSCGCMRSENRVTPDRKKRTGKPKKTNHKKISRMSAADIMRLSKLAKTRGCTVTTYSATHPPYMYTALCPDPNYMDAP